MTQQEISLLVYLESQLVTAQGYIHQGKLNPTDFKTMKEWELQGHMQVKTLKQPSGIKNPVYTHRIRMSEELMERAWSARYAKSVQFSPIIKNEASALPPANGQVTEPDQQESETYTQHEEDPTFEDMYEGYIAFLEAHKTSPTPIQAQIAAGIFNVLSQKENRFFMNGKRTGKSWLLKTIDQYITSIHKNKKSD